MSETETKPAPGPQWDKVEVAFDFEESCWEIYIPDTIQRVSITEVGHVNNMISALPALIEACEKVKDAMVACRREEDKTDGYMKLSEDWIGSLECILHAAVLRAMGGQVNGE